MTSAEVLEAALKNTGDKQDGSCWTLMGDRVRWLSRDGLCLCPVQAALTVESKDFYLHAVHVLGLSDQVRAEIISAADKTTHELAMLGDEYLPRHTVKDAITLRRKMFEVFELDPEKI